MIENSINTKQTHDKFLPFLHKIHLRTGRENTLSTSCQVRNERVFKTTDEQEEILQTLKKSLKHTCPLSFRLPKNNYCILIADVSIYSAVYVVMIK